MLCGGARWKREQVAEYTWDLVDVRQFHDTCWARRLQYCLVHVLVFKTALVCISEIYTLIFLLLVNHWTGQVLENTAGDKTLHVPLKIGKWIFLGCIVVSLLILLWQVRKARAILQSRNISRSFTNALTNTYLSLKSYDHFCFFSQIDKSKKKTDYLAFFVYFNFKGSLELFVDAPRQIVNGMALYTFGLSINFPSDFAKWHGGSFAKGFALITMSFTVLMWVCSFLLLIATVVLYVPLLCCIQGSLKKYCLHMVTKRVTMILKHHKPNPTLRDEESMDDGCKMADDEDQDEEGHEMSAPQHTIIDFGMPFCCRPLSVNSQKKDDTRSDTPKLGNKASRAIVQVTTVETPSLMSSSD